MANIPVFQTNVVTPGHIATYSTDGVIQDGGTATDFTVPLGTRNGSSPNPFTQLLLGVGTTEAYLSNTSYGGAAHLPLNVISNGNTVMTITDAGVNIPGSPFVAASLVNIAQLRADASSYPSVFVEGYYAAGGSGGGIFVLVSSDTTSADNGGTIIINAAGKRYYRVLTDNTIELAWFGVKGDGTTDDTLPVLSALSLG